MDKMAGMHSVTLGCRRGTDGQIVGGLHSVTLGWETQMDRQTGGLRGVTPGRGAAEEQAVRQMDRMDTGQQCQCPWGHGRTEGGMVGVRAGAGPEGSGSTERGGHQQQHPPTRGPRPQPPQHPHSGGSGAVQPSQRSGVWRAVGSQHRHEPWNAGGSQPPPLRDREASLPSLTGEGRECKGVLAHHQWGGQGGSAHSAGLGGAGGVQWGTLEVTLAWRGQWGGHGLRDAAGCREGLGALGAEGMDAGVGRGGWGCRQDMGVHWEGRSGGAAVRTPWGCAGDGCWRGTEGTGGMWGAQRHSAHGEWVPGHRGHTGSTVGCRGGV